MENIDHISWLERLETTEPIKSVIHFVRELSQNYDKRIAAMHAEHQKNIDALLKTHENEKLKITTNLEATVKALQLELRGVQHCYQAICIEYKLTQDCLDTTKQEIVLLTKALCKEEELVTMIQESIRVSNQQLKNELAISVATDTVETHTATVDATTTEIVSVTTPPTVTIEPKNVRHAMLQKIIKLVWF